MTNYIVTGSAGFIGSRVVELLVEQGNSVIGIDNLNNAYDIAMKEYRLRKLKEPTQIHISSVGYFRP